MTWAGTTAKHPSVSSIGALIFSAIPTAIVIFVMAWQAVDEKYDMVLWRGLVAPLGKINPQGAARILAALFEEDWGEYPAPHTDEDDTCLCPDHRSMRRQAITGEESGEWP
jgi:hypothetical protein